MDLLWLIFESIEALLFSLDFANNTILSCFFNFFLIIDFYFLFAAVTNFFNSIVELAIRIVIPNKEAKSETETHPVSLELTISKRLK